MQRTVGRAFQSGQNAISDIDGVGAIWSDRAKFSSYKDPTGKVISTKGNLGDIDVGLMAASDGKCSINRFVHEVNQGR